MDTWICSNTLLQMESIGECRGVQRKKVHDLLLFRGVRLVSNAAFCEKHTDGEVSLLGSFGIVKPGCEAAPSDLF